MQDVERPLLPKLSYLIQKYAADDDMNQLSKLTAPRPEGSQQRSAAVSAEASADAHDPMAAAAGSSAEKPGSAADSEMRSAGRS